MPTASKCYQAPHRACAWCAVHDEPPDWGTEVRRGSGWWCNAGGMHFVEVDKPVCRDEECWQCAAEREPETPADDSAARFALVEMHDVPMTPPSPVGRTRRG